MKNSKVTVGLLSSNSKDTLAVTLTGDGNVLHTVHWALEDIEREGYLGICEKLGNAVIRLLSQHHSGVFEKYPLIQPPPSLVSDPVHMVMELMALCVKFRTRVYVPAIDDLFDRYPDELAKTNLQTDWPSIKAGFLEFNS